MKRKHKPIAKCLVAHYDKDHNLLPPCILCSYCHEWIAYGHYDDMCDYDPESNWKTCDHQWKVTTWSNPEYFKNSTQSETCKTCHATRSCSPALSNGTYPNNANFEIIPKK